MKELVSNKEKDLAVVILAAGNIKDKYRSYAFIYDSPALVPVASRSTISFILAFYERVSSKIYLSINQEDENLFKTELQYYENIHLITIRHSSGVCDTLKQTLELVKENDVIINLGTTIPTTLINPHNILIDKELCDHSGYSGVRIDQDKVTFITKSQNTIVGSFQAFTGIIRHNKTAMTKGLGQISNTTDLIELAIWLRKHDELDIQFTEWIDTGHEINYASARKKLISSRSFNTISIDNHKGVLTKKSEKVDKLIQETNYIGMLPATLKILYPRIIGLDAIAGAVQMEYYGYPNLAEYQLYRAIDSLQWARIFDALYYSLRKMSAHSFSIGPKAFINFYWTKSEQRLEEYFQSLPEEHDFKNAERININGLDCINYPQLKHQIEDRICALYNEDHFCVMHGDLCFNNILFDTFSETLKLIDPRGSFGASCVGIYGDQKYDLAKLMHSTLGHYDYIVNNLFRIEEVAPSTYSYSFSLRENQTILTELSYALLQKTKYRKEDILFIVGLLFLSMCPLHADNPLRQKVMYLHGLVFINKYR